MTADQLDDQLVTDYLNRLHRATRGLDARRRDELIGEVRDHIRDARAGASTSVELILAGLGPPEQIAHEAGAPSRTSQEKAYDLATVLLIGLGSLCAGVGWLVGVIMLVAGPRWTPRDRLIGTFVPPFGAAGVLVLNGWLMPLGGRCVSLDDGPKTCTPPLVAGSILIALHLAYVIVGGLTCVYLAKRAARGTSSRTA